MKKIFLSILILLYLFFPNSLFAQETQITRPEQMEGDVVKVEEQKQQSPDGNEAILQKLEVLVTSGRLDDQTITIEQTSVGDPRHFSVGDKVMVSVNRDLNGNEAYFVSDYIRRTPLYFLFGLFLLLVAVIAGKRGIYSMGGMVISFGVIFFFLLPAILNGVNPVLAAILSSIVIIPSTFFSSHGFNRKTVSAVIGTFVSLIITGILAVLFVEAAKISGFASEEAAFVKAAQGDLINIKGLLLAGIIIGVLGVLDDITVAQANVVYQLKKLSSKLDVSELYKRAMDVGKDHIASMVNTLILVYTGAALPLLLLFINNSAPFSEVINYEVVAEEIVRTLVASIGLVLAVPITTYITALMISQPKSE
jgi:uncharacterized membrane protein